MLLRKAAQKSYPQLQRKTIRRENQECARRGHIHLPNHPRNYFVGRNFVDCASCGVRSIKYSVSAIIAVTDLISPTPPILTGTGTLAWHRRSIWRYRPTPLKSFLRNTEVSVRLFVVRQIPAPSFPKENILPRPVFGTRKRSRIRRRILRLAELFKMNARLVRALRRDIQPSARRVGR